MPARGCIKCRNGRTTSRMIGRVGMTSRFPIVGSAVRPGDEHPAPMGTLQRARRTFSHSSLDWSFKAVYNSIVRAPEQICVSLAGRGLRLARFAVRDLEV